MLPYVKHLQMQGQRDQALTILETVYGERPLATIALEAARWLWLSVSMALRERWPSMHAGSLERGMNRNRSEHEPTLWRRVP